MSTEMPRLRNVNAFPVNLSGRQVICLQDPYHFNDEPVFVPENVFFIISLFDGNHSILDIQEQYVRRYGDIIMSDKIRKIIDDLDSALMLESVRFEEYRKKVAQDFAESPLRIAMFAGELYQSDPDLLKDQLGSFFDSDEGPGQPDLAKETSDKIRGIIAPHIDLARGGTCYAYAYKEIAENLEPDLFIILGTSHSQSENLFILTEKDFLTPLGVAKTDKDIVRSIADKYKSNLFKDELIHKFEHSIEFQVIFLQFLFGENVRIVPILCSSFREMITSNTAPSKMPEFADFVSILKEVVSDNGGYLISSADLSHVGRKFGDDIELSSGLLDLIKSRDLEMLKYIEQLDAERFFSSIQETHDERNICGLSPIYTMLSAMNASHGKLLKYSQSPDYHTESVVSFASMSFV